MPVNRVDRLDPRDRPTCLEARRVGGRVVVEASPDARRRTGCYSHGRRWVSVYVAPVAVGARSMTARLVRPNGRDLEHERPSGDPAAGLVEPLGSCCAPDELQ